jgi:acyl-coenzyme A thioesterase PaaI-like protein
MGDDEDRRFGELPLAQTVTAAAAIRRLTGMLLSLEQPNPTVDAMLAQFADWERELAPTLPVDSRPRMSTDDDSKRIHLQRAFDIGDFNPCFPEYHFDEISAETASGRVSFPVVYEGPPGLVHGGFIGVFFDCVIQHHSCSVGRAGETRSLTVSYRKPTPLNTELHFDIARTEREGGITATARLTLGGRVLCVGEADTVSRPAERLVASRFGQRRID